MLAATREVVPPPLLDPRFVQWLALQTLHERHARLVEGGAEANAQKVDIASIFIDLPVYAARARQRDSSETHDAMAYLLGLERWAAERFSQRHASMPDAPRFLLVGGPGSGKSTLTTMIAHVLRLAWVNRQADVLTGDIANEWKTASEALTKLIETSEWSLSDEPLPLRIQLPLVARWLAMAADSTGQTIAHYLAGEINKQLGDEGVPCELGAEDVQAWLDAVPRIYWIFDGLDEVPMSAGRTEVIHWVRKGIRVGSQREDSILVVTRPQGYAREFDDLDEIELRPLPPETARRYAETLIRLWTGQSRKAVTVVAERLRILQEELTKPSIETLLQTPLHTTIAALLVANEGKLPRSRSELFEDYFQTILRRELNKPFDFGIRREDTGVLRALHTHAGLTLHVRSQQGTGARSTLRRREMREMLAAWYRRQGHTSETAIEDNINRLMGFAVERLVLLLHWSEGEYEFGVRSLQEFFAAEALVDADGPTIEKRLAEVATNPHWTNVLRLVASHGSREMDRRATQLTKALVNLCRIMNDGGIGGEIAKTCSSGSGLAFAFLQETEEYGQPLLHEPLWSIALEGAGSDLAADLGKLAANWSGTNGATYRDKVLSSAAMLFEAGGEARFDAWQLLYGLLGKKDPAAIALANRFEPKTKEEIEEIFDFFLADDLPSWWVQLVGRHPAWFPPEDSMRWFDDDPLPPAFHYAQIFTSGMPIGLEIGSDSEGLKYFLTSFDSDAPWDDALELASSGPPSWRIWQRMAEWMAEPSHEGLADVLEAIDSDEILRQVCTFGLELPWPLATCLYFAQSHADRLALASSLRAGELGTVDDWQAAEARWSEAAPIALDDMKRALVGPLPWGRDIGESGIVFSDMFEPRFVDDDDEFATWRSMIRNVWKEHPEARPRVLPLLAYFNAYNDFDDAMLLEIAEAQDQRSEAQSGGMFYRHIRTVPDLNGPNAEHWFDFLEQRGRQGTNERVYLKPAHTDARTDVLFSALAAFDWRYQYPKFLDWLRDRTTTNITALFERIRVRPAQWGLLDALYAFVYGLPDTDLSTLVLPDLGSDAPPRAQALCALLHLLHRETEGTSRTALLEKLVFTEDGTTVDFRTRLADVLERRTADHHRTEVLLVDALHSAPPPRHDVRDELKSALQTYARRSLHPSFLTRDAWTTHEWPEPCLSEPCPVAPPSRLVRISELRNVRLFKETPSIHEPFHVPPSDQGQWIVLVGENGVGKTTLLRAIALALTSPTIATELLDEALPMLTNGGEGSVSVDLDSGTYAITIRRNDADRKKEVVESRSAPAQHRPWVVGYGVRRGNARGDRDRVPSRGVFGELHTLFEHPPALHHAIRWLADRDADVAREQRKLGRDGDVASSQPAAIWKTIGHALRTLLGITNITVESEYVINVQHEVFGRVRLDALSDGYLTTAGWVLDMLARWIERQRELDEHIGSDVLRQMRGFVFIDEIDLHLHPIWQLNIINDIRRLFPNLSFVVTTHNPLTLHGARPGEVHVMRRQEDGRIELVQKDIQPGHDVDRILFEQFKVDQTFDKETRDLLRDHKEMLKRGVPREDPKRIDVEARLGVRLGGIATTVKNERAATLEPLRPVTDEERSKALAAFQSMDDDDSRG